MSWPDRTLVFDVESTGIDVFNDRIVQLFIGIADDNGDLVEQYEWLIDPGIEVPEEASNVHGFTTQYLHDEGEDPRDALKQAWAIFEYHQNIPFAAFNLNYDLSILHAEFKRNRVTRGFGGWAQGGELIDGLVIDRAKDKFRKGKRKLEFMAAHYGIPFDPESAHNAAYDVEVTAKVTRAIVSKYGMMSNEEQAVAYKEWAHGLETYLKRTDESASVDGNWPLKLKGD